MNRAEALGNAVGVKKDCITHVLLDIGQFFAGSPPLFGGGDLFRQDNQLPLGPSQAMICSIV